jgi:hypothetical protein
MAAMISKSVVYGSPRPGGARTDSPAPGRRVRSPFAAGYEAGRKCARAYWTWGFVVGTLATVGVLSVMFLIGRHT